MAILMTDTERDLIQRMARALDLYRQMALDDYTSTHPFADEARTLLSQPEPEAPTDEELLAIAIESELVASNGTNPFREDSDIEDEVMQFARTVLARWGRPAVKPETNGQT